MFVVVMFYDSLLHTASALALTMNCALHVLSSNRFSTHLFLSSHHCTSTANLRRGQRVGLQSDRLHNISYGMNDTLIMSVGRNDREGG